MIVSTGMSTLKEVEEAVEAIRETGNEQIVLLHCVTAYPAPIEAVNLKAIDLLSEKFNVPVGYSDHTQGITIPVASVAFGAVALEKHFTLDKKMPGPDHRLSADPEELRKMVEEIRTIEKAIGNAEKKVTDAEKNMHNIRVKIVAAKSIKKGTIISREMLGVKIAPDPGLEPKNISKILGKKAKIDLPKDENILWEKIE